jgi:predicted AAA+ superfamily ATPase
MLYNTPFSRNIRVELTKMPEVFMEDTGMMNLLNHKTFNREITGSIFETSIFSLLRKNVGIENIFFWRTSRGHEIDFVYEPKFGELNALEVKLRFSKQRLTAIDYFMNEYSAAKAFLVTLEKLAAPPGGIDIVYPWELYEKLLKK